VNDAVAVALKFVAQRTRGERMLSAAALRRTRGVGRKELLLVDGIVQSGDLLVTVKSNCNRLYIIYAKKRKITLFCKKEAEKHLRFPAFL
jgi:hypoxanthine-guanine phosphoribosyltransferase